MPAGPCASISARLPTARLCGDRREATAGPQRPWQCWKGLRSDLASDRPERRLTAILVADIAGYSRLMGGDEEGTLARMKVHRRAVHEVAQNYDRAAALYRRGLEERPHATWIYRNLASALAGAGRMEEAREAYGRMLIYYPELTASRLRQAMVFSAASLDRMTTNLRKLGLPD